ncbi:MAG: BMP family ABC transporter substrate-binding protein [Eubacteriales bacterium]|nr:BMP family ABC transporter substrate-binding protein [Eubacteriales bacterium]
MKKWMVTLLAVTVSVPLLLAGCGAKKESSDSKSSVKQTEGSKTAQPTESDVKAACILGIGGRGDQGFNDLIYSGMEKAKSELGVDFDFSEPKQVTDYEVIMRDMSDSGKYGVIVCVGFDQQDALSKVAKDYPDQKYAIIDGNVEGDNIAAYSCKEQEGSFMVGALAALMKKDAASYKLQDNHQFGFVGALETPLINRFAAGYQAGALYIDPEAKVDIAYVSGDKPFSDTTTAKEIANSQFTKGTDIIYHAAGGSGLGVFTAAKESNFIAIGCNSNQNILDPDHIVASMLKRADTAAFDIVKNMKDGKLKTGEVVVLGIADEGIGYTLEGSNIKIPDDIKKQLDDIQQKMMKGEIEVPDALK